MSLFDKRTLGDPMSGTWLYQQLTRRGLIASSVATAGLSISGAALLAGDYKAAPGSDNASSEPSHGTHAPTGHDAHGNMISVGDVDVTRNGFNPSAMLTDWDTGEVSQLPDGRTVRTFHIAAADKEIEIAPGILFPAWTYNGRVPGPSLRVTEGDRVRIYFQNGGSHPHSMHLINSLHLHANFFDYYDHGTTLTPTLKTVDTVVQCQAQRGILEFTFKEHEPGLYMFHAHQSEFAELGWMGMFDVTDAVA
jgi:FtsP/CotA-like multicopper oxidase with cupredoxin domain